MYAHAYCARELNGVYMLKWRRSKTEIAAMDLDLAF